MTAKILLFKRNSGIDHNNVVGLHQVNMGGSLVVGNQKNNTRRRKNIRKRNSLEEIIHKHSHNATKESTREIVKSTIERQLEIRNGSIPNDKKDNERLTIESLSEKLWTKKLCIPVDKEGVMVKNGKKDYFISVDFIREYIRKDVDELRCKEKKKVEAKEEHVAPKIEEIG